ncbi:MAG: OsmC family protein [Myxococcaceae bacterium]
MSTAREILIRLPGGRRVEASVGLHLVRTDQPQENGGEDTAPSPFDLFLASLGTCAGIFVQGFCARREIPFEGIVLRETVDFDAEGTLQTVHLDIELPPSFPEKYREALIRAVDQCSVKRAISAQPAFEVRALPQLQAAPAKRGVPG